jgi:plasmid stabilization system protein ParE
VIRLTAAAERQFDALLDHYAQLGRFEASRALVAAVDQAMLQIERDPASGLPAPRPYPQVSRPGRAWIKAGRYWVGYTTSAPLTVVAVFYDTADIPERYR